MDLNIAVTTMLVLICSIIRILISIHNKHLLHSSIVTFGATHFSIPGHRLLPSHIILTFTLANIRPQKEKGCLNSIPIVAASLQQAIPSDSNKALRACLS